MSLIHWLVISARYRSWLVAGKAIPVIASTLLLALGCNRPDAGSGGNAPATTAETPTPTVTTVKPERGILRRSVRQPGHIQAFEQTPVFAKIPGFVQKWHV